MDDSRISDRQPKNQPAGQPERAAYRRLQVLKYRAAGVSYRDIAESLGTGLGTVFRDDKTALGELAKLTNQETALRRALEDTRLDNYLLKLQADLQSDDPDRKLRAIDRALRISERRSRLWGLDIPVVAPQVQVTLTPTELAALSDDELDRLITHLELGQIRAA